MAQREFEYSDAKSYKFWNVEVKGTDVLTTYGRVGTNGQTTIKSFKSVAEAEKAGEKLIKQKLGKGYNEKAGTAKKAPATKAPAKKTTAKKTTAKKTTAKKTTAKKTTAKKTTAKKTPAKKTPAKKTPAKTPAAKKKKSAGGRREFHFISGSSSKFWAIELKGSSLEIAYGKIGTDGRTQPKDFPSADKAEAAYNKLVEEKTTKGYVEVSGDDGASGGVLKEMMFSTTKNEDDIGDMSTFVGQRVVDYKSEKSIKKGKSSYVYRIRVDYDDGDAEFENRLKGFLDSDAALEAIGLVIGNWTADSGESSAAAVKTLVANKDRLPKLVAIFLGDIGQEENEMSWIQQSDVSPLPAAFPQLEMLRVRGGTDLDLKTPRHANLRALALETGGLNRTVVAQLSKAKFPNLEYLELWLGTEEYGGTTRVNDLQPILKGKVFPKLKYLGLRNSEIVDEIAGVIINSPIVKQVETLDLSLGTLTDEGAGALMNLPPDANLKRLDLHYHFMTKPAVKKLKSLPFTVNTAEVQEPDDWGDGEMRFIAVGE